MNPATRLAEIIDTWISKDGFARQQRPLNTEEEQQLSFEAVSCLKDIKLIFESAKHTPNMQHFNVFEGYFNSWVSLVFHYPKFWGNEKLFIEKSDLDMLKALGGLLTSYLGSNTYTPATLYENKPRILEAIKNLQHLLIEDESLDANLKNHISWLLTKIIDGLEDEEAAGVADLVEALWQLRIFVEAAATRTADPSKSEEFKAWVSSFFAHPFVNTVVGSAIGTTTALLGISQ